MSTTQTPPTQASQFPPLSEIGTKTLDAVSAITEAGQRVGGQIIELWATTAADRLRTLGEMQAAALEAARGALTPVSPRESLSELRQDPAAWYRKGVASMLEGTQRALKLIETNTHIISRNAERFQGTAERTGQEIENAVSTCASRLRELYGTRG